MFFATALILSYAVTVAAPDGPDFGCPSPGQITTALANRSPGTVVPRDDATTPGLLRLQVTGGGPAGPLHVSLVDDGGDQRLRRVLPAESQAGATDCVALAETVALIVDRFLHDVGAPVPAAGTGAADAVTDGSAGGGASSGMGSRLALSVSGAWRAAASAAGPEATVGFEISRAYGGLGISGGLTPELTGRWSTGEASLHRYPLRLGLFAVLPAGAGRLEPSLALTTDLMVVTSSGVGGPRGQPHFSPGAEGGLGYRLALGTRFFARVAVMGGAAVPYRFVVPDGDGQSLVLATPRIYVRTGIALGTYFR